MYTCYMNPKTIITYLVDWTISWVKTIEFSNKLIKWISIPRKDFKNVLDRNELNYAGVYFLIWEDELGNDIAYIWQATILWKRLHDHYKNTSKDFWNTIICFVYKDWSLTETDINYLEKELIHKTKHAKRYIIANSTMWNTWLISEHRLWDMKEFINDIEVLISVAWYSVLKEIKKEESKERTYYLSIRWSKASWLYTQEWFLVLQWSTWPHTMIKSEIDRKWSAFRQRPLLQQQWIITYDDTTMYFTQDHLFWSPSGAACCISGGSINWRIERKDINGKTLDENERIQ